MVRDLLLGTACVASLLLVASCASVTSPVGRDPAFAGGAGPVIVAHRGGALEAPENTLAAVRHGIGAGSDWQEIDVQLSLDQRVIVIHDDTLDRTTNGSGPVGEMLAADLQQLTSGNPGVSEKLKERLELLGVPEPRFGDRFAGERVPSLEQVLQLQHARLMLEIKTDPRSELVVRKIVEEIDRAEARGRVAIASSDQAILGQALARAPSIPLIGIAKSEEAIEAMLEMPIRALAVRAPLVTIALERAPAVVAIWGYTAYTPEQATEFAQQGVHGIVTDVPMQVIQLRRRNRLSGAE
jgi:glycerophosphoryl diester phosphodiesterase